MSFDRVMACFRKTSPGGVLLRKSGPCLTSGSLWNFNSRLQTIIDPLRHTDLAFKTPAESYWGIYGLEAIARFCRAPLTIPRFECIWEGLNEKRWGRRPSPWHYEAKIWVEQLLRRCSSPQQSCIVDSQAEGTLAVGSDIPLRRSMVMKVLGLWKRSLDTWGRKCRSRQVKIFGPLDEIPLVENNGRHQHENHSNLVDKKRGESRTDLPRPHVKIWMEAENGASLDRPLSSKLRITLARWFEWAHNVIGQWQDPSENEHACQLEKRGPADLITTVSTKISDE